MYQGNFFLGGVDMLITVTNIWILKQRFDDDNWFNRKWKRLRASLKKVKERLQSIFTPTPLPVFG